MFPPKSEKERVRDYNNFAAGFTDGLVKTGKVKGGEITAERVVKPHGVEGFERDISFTDHQARLQVFHVGRSWLAVASVWTAENAPAERNAFFHSVKLETGKEPSNVVALKCFSLAPGFSPVATRDMRMGNRLNGFRFQPIEGGSISAAEAARKELERLATEQHVQPITDFDSLKANFWPEDENVDDFVRTVRERRRASEMRNLE